MPDIEHSCCGVVQEAAVNAREKREKRLATKQPWITLKLALFISVALLIYTAYVYIGRLCVPMLIQRQDALGSKSYGIAFLVVYSILFILTCWSYAMVSFTSPGFAKDHVPQVPRPAVQSWNSNIELEGTPYEHHAEPSTEEEQSPNSPTSLEPKKPKFTRRPPQTPVLLPEHRYCAREGIVKPVRTHHCRACGACVLKYDHHCPWIGQCVGARNHKYFVTFVLWTFIYCLWVLTTLIGLIVRPKYGPASNNDIDPQHIVAMVFTGFFGLFTGTMFITHVRMICLNISTVEQIKIMNMNDHESALLGQMFSWWELRARRATKREWDTEWGALNTEGNIWWLGSKRRNWESVMGTRVWAWFLPVGRSESDGLDYPMNPRFGPDGRWRRRREWPEELR